MQGRVDQGFHGAIEGVAATDRLDAVAAVRWKCVNHDGDEDEDCEFMSLSPLLLLCAVWMIDFLTHRFLSSRLLCDKSVDVDKRDEG
mmetsp:Transcript_26891/g.74117  ORF Transcript_26891/g.74117 Transcript_26891/m.74117 type:complete len:87 (+) Transcript_26891:1006-1266(+)